MDSVSSVLPERFFSPSGHRQFRPAVPVRRHFYIPQGDSFQSPAQSLAEGFLGGEPGGQGCGGPLSAGPDIVNLPGGEVPFQQPRIIEPGNHPSHINNIDPCTADQESLSRFRPKVTGTSRGKYLSTATPEGTSTWIGSV